MPSPNDDFAGRTALSGASGTESDDISGATSEFGEPVVYYSQYIPGATLWYEWTCPGTGFYRFYTETSGVNLQLAVYTGSTLTSLTKIGAMDGGTTTGPVDSEVGFDATNGSLYQIQVGTNDLTSPDLTFDLKWATHTKATNGTFATAEVLSGVSGTISGGDNLGMDPVPEEDTPDLSFITFTDPDEQSGRVVWFKYVAPHTGLFAFTLDVPNFNMKYGWFAGTTLEDLTIISDANGVIYSEDVEIEVSMVSGNTYYLLLAGDFYPGYYTGGVDEETEQGHFDLSWDIFPPFNDNMQDAELYAIGNLQLWQYYDPSTQEYAETVTEPAGGRRSGSNVNASTEVGEPAILGFGPTRTVWYYIIVPEDGDYKFWIEGEGADPVVDPLLAVYDWVGGDPSTLAAPLADDDDSGPGLMPEVTVTLVSFTAYFIQVDARDEGDFRIVWQFQPTGTAPANDDFANAVTLVDETPVAGTTEFSTVESAEQMVMDNNGGPADGVWYTFTPVATNVAKIQFDVTSGPDVNDQFLEAYEGTTLENIAPIDYVEVVSGPSPFLFIPTNGGIPIYLRVSSRELDYSTFDIELQVQGVPPSNDDFVDAEVIVP